MLWILRTLCPLRLMLPAVFLAAVSLASVSALSAQETPAASAGQDNQKAYARSPKDIVFQNDSQWEDNRWQRTEVGPFLCGTIRAGRATTLKGIAIRVGDSGEAGVLFDTAPASQCGVDGRIPEVRTAPVRTDCAAAGRWRDRLQHRTSRRVES